MTKVVDHRFKGHQHSAIAFDDETVEHLRTCFVKFLPQDRNKIQAEKLNPTFMQYQFEKNGMDKSDPSMYAMVCWMTEVNKDKGSEGITFEEFINNCAFFFTQRHHDEGLRYIFELYDTEKKGKIDIYALQRICIDLEMNIS